METEFWCNFGDRGGDGGGGVKLARGPLACAYFVLDSLTILFQSSFYSCENSFKGKLRSFHIMFASFIA